MTIPAVRILLCLLILQLVPTRALSQELPSAMLITIGPGDLAYERYGHNMLHVRDPERQIDVVFNWGIFEFGEGFIFNFIQGRLWYSMDEDFSGPAGPIGFYRSQDRTVWVQELNLTPQQVRGLLDLCMRDLGTLKRPGGYRYDYFKDNCSTRVRDAIDEALAGQLRRQATTRPSGATFRSETRRLMAADLPLYLGLNYVLGHPTDTKLSSWEEMFIPMRLQERLNEMTIRDESGNEIPLVRKETVVHVSGHIQQRPGPPRWTGWFLLVGAAIGAILAWSGSRARGGSRGAQWGFAVVAVAWGLAAGGGGLILTYLWLLTDHAASRPNENILQLGPWALPLVAAVPMAVWARKGAVRATLIIAGIGFGLSMLGLILKVLPMMDQANSEIIALALPAHAGLAWAAWKLNGSRPVGVAVAERSVK